MRLDLKKTTGLSFLAHLAMFLIFQVRVEFSYQRVLRQPYRISFLGAILDDGAFRVVSLGGIKSERTAKIWVPMKSLTPLSIDSEQRNSLPENILNVANPGLFEWKSMENIHGKRVYVSSRDSELVFMDRLDSSFITLEGDVKKRAVLWRPRLLEYLESNGRLLPYFNMSFRFHVSIEGIVDYAEPILSSGEPELDVLGMSYLRQWRFISGHSRVTKLENSSQWGVLKIHFSKKHDSY